MAILAAFALTDNALKSFDEWMTVAFLTVDKPDSTAAAIWSDVLQELDRRGLVKLISGSYGDVVNLVYSSSNEYGQSFRGNSTFFNVFGLSSAAASGVLSTKNEYKVFLS